MSRRIPDHIKKLNKMTGREWKSLKRKQLRKVVKAVDELRSGCAYFPSGSNDLDDVETILLKIKQDISVKNWGR